MPQGAHGIDPGRASLIRAQSADCFGLKFLTTVRNTVPLIVMLFAATALCFVTVPRVACQDKESVDVIKVDTNLVVFDVQVIDRKTKSNVVILPALILRSGTAA